METGDDANADDRDRDVDNLLKDLKHFKEES
jgi:hypothetical protein